MPQALSTLLSSSKAWVLVCVTALITVALYQQLITSEQWQELLMVLVPGWMVAHAGERGATAIAEARKEPPQ